MILAFLGAPRTATKSLWTVLSKHKNIAGSIIKEPFNKKYIIPHFYLNEFKITGETKILLDGTPCAYYYYNDKVKKIEMDIKIIYPVRNPYDRMYSTIKQLILTHANKWWAGNKPDFIKDKLKIDKEKIIHLIPTILDSVYLKQAYDVTDKVLIIRWDKMIKTKLSRVFDFLEIESININFPITNTMNSWYTKNYCKQVKADVDLFFYEKKDQINEIILKDLKKIRHKIYVEDWINENINNT